MSITLAPVRSSGIPYLSTNGRMSNIPAVTTPGASSIVWYQSKSPTRSSAGRKAADASPSPAPVASGSDTAAEATRLMCRHAPGIVAQRCES